MNEVSEQFLGSLLIEQEDVSEENASAVQDALQNALLECLTEGIECRFNGLGTFLFPDLDVRPAPERHQGEEKEKSDNPSNDGYDGDRYFHERVILPEPKNGNDGKKEDEKREVSEESNAAARVPLFDRWADYMLSDGEITRTDSIDLWQKLLDTVRNTLAENGEVRVADVGVFRVSGEGQQEEGEETTPGSNDSLISLQVHFEPMSGLENRLPAGVLFDATQRMKATLATYRFPFNEQVLFVIPEVDFFFEMLTARFEEEELTARFVHQEQLARSSISSNRKHIIILDTEMDFSSTLIRELRGNSIHSACTEVIQIFPEQSNPDRPDEFLVYGNEKIKEPFDADQLLDSVRRARNRLEENAWTEHEVSYAFPSGDESLEEAHQFTEQLIHQCDLEEEERMKLRAAFREAIGNAAQHGNHYRRDRRIECRFLHNFEKIQFRVRDEGSGFDWEKYVERAETEEAISATRERHQEGKYGGFGIMLMLRTVDDLTYNDQGNVLTLTMYHTDAGEDFS